MEPKPSISRPLDVAARLRQPQEACAERYLAWDVAEKLTCSSMSLAGDNKRGRHPPLEITTAA